MPLFNHTVKGKYYITPVADKRNMSMDHWWNGNDRRNSKYSERSLSLCSLVYSKSHTNWPGIEPELKTRDGT